jgi:uncharacterized membrane protein HdeD (DUF308 family)
LISTTLLIIIDAITSDSKRRRKSGMPKIVGLWTGIIAIVVGILVLVFPDLLRWILGIGLIVVGLLAVLKR